MSTTDVQLPAVSKEFLYINGIQAFDANSPDHATNPTSLPIQIALIAPGTDPVELDWVDAAWFDQTTARILTGAGGAITPAVGRYAIWLRITGAVEQPERRIGTIDVT